MTELKKPSCTPSDVHADDRGVFVPWLKNAQQLHEVGGLPIVRMYYVVNHGKGVIRGFHFHEREWKVFTVAAGTAKFVCVRPENATDLHTFVSSSRKPNVIVVPPGYANGWMSLEESTILLCASTSSMEDSIKDDVRMDPYRFGDVWSIKPR